MTCWNHKAPPSCDDHSEELWAFRTNQPSPEGSPAASEPELDVDFPTWYLENVFCHIPWEQREIRVTFNVRCTHITALNVKQTVIITESFWTFGSLTRPLRWCFSRVMTVSRFYFSLDLSVTCSPAGGRRDVSLIGALFINLGKKGGGEGRGWITHWSPMSLKTR